MAWLVMGPHAVWEGGGFFTYASRSCRSPLPRFDSGRITPKRFQVVPLPHVRAHYVDDDIEVIQHHPRRVECPVYGLGSQSAVFTQTVSDLVHNRPQMRLTRPRGNHEVIRDRRKLTHVQDNYVFRLSIVCQFAAKQRQFS